MSEVQPFTITSLLSPNDSRRAARQISTSRAVSQVRSATIADETDVTSDKIDSLTTITGLGMAAVTRVAQAQGQCETVAPGASGRLELLANNHAFAVADVQTDHQRTLRRR